MNIGYVNPEYCALRNIIGKCPGYSYVRVRSFKSLFERIGLRLGGRSPGVRPYVFWGGIAERLSRVDLFHFWNNIAIWPCRKPYVTTFESSLPRAFPEGRLLESGLKSLVSNQCRRLIASSESARELQLKFNADHEIGSVDEKITVLLPPQEMLTGFEEVEERFRSRDKVKVLFCGKDFFRKGGSEIVRALVRVRQDFPVEAYLVGDFNHVDYASSWEVDSADEMRRLIDGNSGWLHHWDRMPNDELLKLARTCHVGLLPTRDDTFGYSVLEFQACGLPCITTDIRALPEVNNTEIGWVISVPKKPDRRADFSTAEKLHELSEQIENGLVEKLRDALSSQEEVFEKSRCAMENLSIRHSPEVFADRLDEIYKEAIS